MAKQKNSKAIANLSYLKRVFSIPGDEMATLHKLEKKLSLNLDEFLKESKVAGEISLETLSKIFSDINLPEDPCFVTDQVNYLLKNVIPHSVHTGSPKFIGHMTSSIPYFLLSLSKCMVALHQNVVKIETSRSFTFLERQTLSVLHRLCYNKSPQFYKKYVQKRNATLGIQCSGGTVANITAMWIARNAFIEEYCGKNKDEQSLVQALLKSGYQNCCILVSQRGHYSLKKAADLIGLGQQGIRVIPVTSKHCMDMKSLKTAYKACLKEKIKPIAVVGIAGTTETGSIDPLENIATFCEEKQLHFHVDAAWGGATLFSETHRKKLKGIEKADSIVLDGHKQLYLPMGVGMLFFKDPKTADLIEHQAQYIIRSNSLDLGKRSLEGSRAGMAMLTHSALNILGRKGYEILINQNIKMAKNFAKLIQNHPDFELITSPQLNILTYRFVPIFKKKKVQVSNRILSDLNTSLQKEQRERGISFVSRTTFRNPEPTGETITVLRSVIANPHTTLQDFKNILEEQSEIGYRLIKKHQSLYI